MDDGLAVSKASLVTLSHAFEEACLHDREPGRLVVACFQQSRHFARERSRYETIARNSGLTLVLHAGTDHDASAPYHELTIPNGHPLLGAWDVIIVSAGAGASLVCQDLGHLMGSERAPERDRAFLARWSFERHTAADEVRQVLGSIEMPADLRGRVDDLLTAATVRAASEEERQLAVAVDHLIRSLESANLHARAANSAADRARTLAERDALTGALNRTFLGGFERRRPTDGPVSAILFDLDRFKQVNDTHGHSAGDRVLQAVSAELRANVRAGDLVVRWGGDEFLVLLPGSDLAAAERQADELVQRLAAIEFPAPLDGYRVSASAGVGTIDGSQLDIESIDAALYAAKRSGGGGVVAEDA